MPNITLVISRKLKMEMKRHPSVKWSSAVRNAIEQKLADFREAESIAKRSKFSLKDWKSISEKVSKNSARHAKALLNESNG
jgi:hypothetical protein